MVLTHAYSALASLCHVKSKKIIKIIIMVIIIIMIIVIIVMIIKIDLNSTLAFMKCPRIGADASNYSNLGKRK